MCDVLTIVVPFFFFFSLFGILGGVWEFSACVFMALAPTSPLPFGASRNISAFYSGFHSTLDHLYADFARLARCVRFLSEIYKRLMQRQRKRAALKSPQRNLHSRQLSDSRQALLWDRLLMAPFSPQPFSNERCTLSTLRPHPQIHCTPRVNG